MRKNTPFLIKELALTDFKIRYSGSVLGYLWSLLNPLLTFAVLYLVFSVFMRFGGIEHYQLYLLLGIIMWNYFAESTGNGMMSMLYKSSLISKINFKKWIILVASNLTSVFTLCLNLIVFFGFFFFSGVSLTSTSWFFLVCLIQLILFSFGVSLILCSFYLKFRDLSHLWGVVLQIGFWMTPVVYLLTTIPEKFRQILFLNPMARIITDARNALIYDSVPTLRHTLVSFFIIGIIFVIGYTVFTKKSSKFAEEL